MDVGIWGKRVIVAAIAVAAAGDAFAGISTERSGSILVFPKIVANGSRDTVVRITNTSNSPVRAHCFYVNGALTDPEAPPGPLNPPLWQEVDFDIVLTKQQPAHWLVSQGRRVDPFDGGTCIDPPLCIGSGGLPEECVTTADCTDGVCSSELCNEAGFDPGRVVPVVPDFVGELKCIEVDQSGAPLAGNHLKGEAVIVQTSETHLNLSVGPGTISLTMHDGGGALESIIRGEMSAYNAIAIPADESNGDGTLVLGGGQCVGAGESVGSICSTNDDCGPEASCAPEYDACPHTWILNHLADGAPNLVLEDTGSGNGVSRVDTELTVVPCSQNFETQEPAAVTLQFLTTNEFESQFSVSTTVACWQNFRLADVGATALTFEGQPAPDPLGTMYLQTRMRAAAGTPYGVLMVAEEFHQAEPGLMQGRTAQFVAPAAVNLHVEGERATPDVITIPAEQLEP